MQENNFEKQVQQKIDELKLKPSDEVWQKVAVAIAKRKSDRRIFAIVILLLLLISSTIFILWDHTQSGKINKLISEKNNTHKTNSIHERASDRNTQQIIDAVNKKMTKSNDSAGDRIRIIKDIPLTKEISTQQKNVSVKITTSIAVDEQANNNPVYPKDVNQNKVSYKTRQKVSTLITNSNPADLANEMIDSNDTSKAIVKTLMPAINEATLNERLMDSVSKSRFFIKERVKDSIAIIPTTDHKKNDVEKTFMHSKQKSQWKLGFNFSLGLTATQNGVLAVIGLGNSDASKSYADALQAGTGVIVPGTNISYAPSKIKVGAGVVMGLFIQKNISPKTNFLVGINYKTYSSAMMIGNRVDSVYNVSGNNFRQGNFFYRTGNKTSYKNHFHFIELPVAIQIKLGKQSKLPVYINTGVSISQLLGSNALQFDPPSGAYYSDNALFNKTQVNVSAGLLFSLSGHAKNPFLIGPDINFSLNKMADSGLYKNRHYSYFGVLMQKCIGKN